MAIDLYQTTFAGTLDALEIDVSKDWEAFNITNIGDIDAVQADIMLNGDFTSASDWDFTGGDGDWFWDAGDERAECVVNVGNDSDLESDVAIGSGQTYLLQFDVAVNNFTLTITCGGVTAATLTAEGSATVLVTKSYLVTTTNTNPLIFNAVCNGAFKARCFIDNVSLQPLGVYSGGVEAYSFNLHSDMTFNSAGINIGEDGTPGVGVGRIFLDNSFSARANPGISGLFASFVAGDMMIGNDSVYPGYYVQKTVLHGSSATDNSDDYTNLYQGDSGYPRIAIMYDIAWNSLYTGAFNAVEVNITGQDSVPLCIGDRFFIQQLRSTGDKVLFDGETRGDIAFFEFNLNYADTIQECLRPGTHDKIDLGDLANTLMWKDGYFSGAVDAIGGFAVNTVAGHTGWFDDGNFFRVTVTGGIITAIGASVAGGFV